MNMLVTLIHAFAAASSLGLAALIVIGAARSPRAYVLALACLGLTGWAGLTMRALLAPGVVLADLLALDALQLACWALIIAASSRVSVAAMARAAACAGLVGLGGALWASGAPGSAAAGLAWPPVFALAAGLVWLMAEVGLGSGLGEQARWKTAWAWSLVVLGLNLGVWSVELQSAPGTVLLGLRALGVWSTAPLLAMFWRDVPELGLRVYVSRQIAVGLTGALMLGVLAVVLIELASTPVSQGQIVAGLLIAASLVALLMLVRRSGKSALWLARLGVFLSKHFYGFKYDYREEWLRLIETLTGSRADLPLTERVIKALAEIVKSPGGVLFVQDSDYAVYLPIASWNTRLNVPFEEVERNSAIHYMERRLWIIDTDEKIPDSDAAGAVPKLCARGDISCLIVPLLLQERLFGFVVLEKGEVIGRLTYEDIDLLRTGGRQVASYLAQHFTGQRLAEALQFQTYGRLTAFFVHDLKNLIAQQSLLVKNAIRHKRNPEFVDDAIRTVESSVDRMQRLLGQLETGVKEARPEEADLAQIVGDAVGRCRLFAPEPRLIVELGPFPVRAHPDRLCFGLSHAIRNAQQATSDAGAVVVELKRDGRYAIVSISDDGRGMSDDFVRLRLFKPFDSTKEGTAMGLGTFQLRETVRAIGGNVAVESREGKGSIFKIRVPIAARRVDEKALA